jgi:hypothetical protein
VNVPKNVYFKVWYFICYLYLFIFIYLEMEFIKSSDDVIIQRKAITFTRDWEYRTVFINKMINTRIMRMFIFFYNFYIYIFYFVSQVLCVCEYNRDYFSMRNNFFFIIFDKE